MDLVIGKWRKIQAFSHFKEVFYSVLHHCERRNSPLDSNHSHLQAVTDLNLFVCMQFLCFQKGVVLGSISLVIDPRLWSDWRINSLFVKCKCLECPVYSLEFRRKAFDFEIKHGPAALKPFIITYCKYSSVQVYWQNPSWKLNIVLEQDFQLRKCPVMKETKYNQT